MNYENSDYSESKYDCNIFWSSLVNQKEMFKCYQQESKFNGQFVNESMCNICNLYGLKPKDLKRLYC